MGEEEVSRRILNYDFPSRQLHVGLFSISNYISYSTKAITKKVNNFRLACWVKFSILSGDSRALYSYSFGLTMMSLYTVAFGFYTNNKVKRYGI